MIKNILLTFLFTITLSFAQTVHTVNAGMNGSDFYFSPSNLIIEQGDIVIWINEGGCHDVNGDINTITNMPYNNPENFDSPTTCEQGAEIFSYTFNTEGIYNYDCSVGNHAINGMVGSISVTSSNNSIVDIIVNSENHNTLEAAVIAAELADDLSGDGPFTVFAPTDEAFNALPEGTVADLLEDPTGQLANILLHHVYAGNALSTDLSDGMMISTLFGTELTVSFVDGGVMIDNAMVTVVDLVADNGVVHVIDAVLIPQDSSMEENNIINDYIIQSFDIYGRKINQSKYTTIQIDLYKSGKSIKKLIINN